MNSHVRCGRLDVGQHLHTWQMLTHHAKRHRGIQQQHRIFSDAFPNLCSCVQQDLPVSPVVVRVRARLYPAGMGQIAAKQLPQCRPKHGTFGNVSIGTQKGPRIGIQKGPRWERLVPVVQGAARRGVPIQRLTPGRAGGPCGPTGASRGGGDGADQARFLNRQLSLPVSTMSQ
jgi:hypothetical protein